MFQSIGQKITRKVFWGTIKKVEMSVHIWGIHPWRKSLHAERKTKKKPTKRQRYRICIAVLYQCHIESFSTEQNHSPHFKVAPRTGLTEIPCKLTCHNFGWKTKLHLNLRLYINQEYKQNVCKLNFKHVYLSQVF